MIYLCNPCITPAYCIPLLLITLNPKPSIMYSHTCLSKNWSWRMPPIRVRSPQGLLGCEEFVEEMQIGIDEKLSRDRDKDVCVHRCRSASFFDILSYGFPKMRGSFFEFPRNMGYKYIEVNIFVLLIGGIYRMGAVRTTIVYSLQWCSTLPSSEAVACERVEYCGWRKSHTLDPKP